MRRTSAWTAGVLVVGLGVAALAGCSSSGGKDSADAGKPSGSAAAPSASGSASASAPASTAPASTAPAGKGHLDYSGARSGGFDAKDTTCVAVGGRLVSVTTVGSQRLKAGDGPGFSATLADGASVATLVTSDGHTYVQRNTTSVSGRKAGDAWVVFVNGAKLGAADGGGSITVNGTLSCVHLKGV